MHIRISHGTAQHSSARHSASTSTITSTALCSALRSMMAPFGLPQPDVRIQAAYGDPVPSASKLDMCRCTPMVEVAQGKCGSF